MPLLIYVVIVLIVIGLVLWVITQLPIDPAIANIIRVVIIVACVIWLLYVLMGFVGTGPGLPGPILRR